MKQFQKGATLIVVLFVLIFMVLIGTLAVKQSLVGLNIATNSQAQSLMKQTADAVFFALEKDNQDTATFQKNLSSLGLFGMVKSDEFLNKELNRTIQKVENALIQSRIFALPKRNQKFSEGDYVIVDVTESQIEHPKKTKKIL